MKYCFKYPCHILGYDRNIPKKINRNNKKIIVIIILAVVWWFNWAECISNSAGIDLLLKLSLNRIVVEPYETVASRSEFPGNDSRKLIHIPDTLSFGMMNRLAKC